MERMDGVGKDLDGKELVFLGEKHPVSRFLYFHFVMALVRIRIRTCRDEIGKMCGLDTINVGRFQPPATI
jgi:hypothetical protein